MAEEGSEPILIAPALPHRAFAPPRPGGARRGSPSSSPSRSARDRWSSSPPSPSSSSSSASTCTCRWWGTSDAFGSSRHVRSGRLLTKLHVSDRRGRPGWLRVGSAGAPRWPPLPRGRWWAPSPSPPGALFMPRLHLLLLLPLPLQVRPGGQQHQRDAPPEARAHRDFRRRSRCQARGGPEVGPRELLCSLAVL